MTAAGGGRGDRGAHRFVGWLAATPNARPAMAMIALGFALLVTATVLAVVVL